MTKRVQQLFSGLLLVGLLLTGFGGLLQGEAAAESAVMPSRQTMAPHSPEPRSIACIEHSSFGLRIKRDWTTGWGK